MGKNNRIRVSGRQRAELDIDLLVQAVLAITEQRLQADCATEEDQDEASA